MKITITEKQRKLIIYFMNKGIESESQFEPLSKKELDDIHGAEVIVSELDK